MLYQVPVNLDERSYSIRIGSDILDHIGSQCAEAGLTGKCLLISDENVGAIYTQRAMESLATAGFNATAITLPAGEQTKCNAELIKLYSKCIEAGLDRKSFLIALGGGVIGDLVGYAAATYLRGIPFVQVPTSLLAMVDSSVGGKTAINLPEGKNLIGSFYQPQLVLADINTLKTLSLREFRAGMAEVVKYGIIYDAPFFEMLEEHIDSLEMPNHPELLAKVVGRCCEIKAEVVALDEREGGLRAILNFGHTVGHALEKVAGYGEYVHGEGVSIGSIFAARISVHLKGLKKEECERIEAIFKKLKLPISASAYTWEKLRPPLAVDKKTVAGMPKFVLAPGIGSVDFGCDVPEELMEETWKSL